MSRPQIPLSSTPSSQENASQNLDDIRVGESALSPQMRSNIHDPVLGQWPNQGAPAPSDHVSGRANPGSQNPIPPLAYYQYKSLMVQHAGREIPCAFVGYREEYIKFSMKFNSVPEVSVGVRQLKAKHYIPTTQTMHNSLSVVVNSANVSLEGFTLRILPGRNMLVEDLIVTWTAVGGDWTEGPFPQQQYY